MLLKKMLYLNVQIKNTPFFHWSKKDMERPETIISLINKWRPHQIKQREMTICREIRHSVLHYIAQD